MSEHGDSSYCCIANHPKHSAAEPCLTLTWAQDSDKAHGFLLLYNIWGHSYQELKAGAWNHLEISSPVCLAVKTSSTEARGQTTHVASSWALGFLTVWWQDAKGEWPLRSKQKWLSHF